MNPSFPSMTRILRCVRKLIVVKWTKRKISTCTPERLSRLHGAAAHAIAPERVLEEMHLHAGAGAFRQRLGERIGDLAFAEEEILERDRPFRGADGLEHGGEDLVAILQRCVILFPSSKGGPSMLPIVRTKVSSPG